MTISLAARPQTIQDAALVIPLGQGMLRANDDATGTKWQSGLAKGDECSAEN